MVSVVPHTPASVPDFTKWPSFPFEGELHVKQLDPPVAVEPPRKGEDSAECVACNAPDEAYIWVSERWRVRTMDRPTGLPMVLILESRSHLDLGDLPNLLAAELGVMTVRLERAIRSLDGVARVHVNRWGDGSAHLHMWFLARPYGRLQLRGTFLSLWDDILPPISEAAWRENLALVAAWLAEFGGRPLAEPPRIQWQAPSNLTQQAEAESLSAAALADGTSVALAEAPPEEPQDDDNDNGNSNGNDNGTSDGNGNGVSNAESEDSSDNGNSNSDGVSEGNSDGVSNDDSASNGEGDSNGTGSRAETSAGK
jgi:diadenosine tetraphosphate (Ap4A) HIT family hydrolase